MVPGECHGHIFMDGEDYPAARERYRKGIDKEDIRRHLSEYRDRGITFFRDGGDPYGASLYARSCAPDYGIDYRTPAFAIHRKGRYGGIVGFAFETMKEYRKLVGRVREEGGDFIKLMFSGLLDFPGDGGVTGEPETDGAIREMVKIAHEEGFAVMAHVNGAAAVLSAIEAGTDSIEHGGWMNGECLEALAGSDTVWVPTIATIANAMDTGRYPSETMHRLMEMHSTNVRKAFSMGACIACGSDAGAYGVLHGQGALDEWRLLCSCAPDPAQAGNVLAEGERKIRGRFGRK